MAAGAPVTYQVTTVTPETQYTPTATPVPGKQVGYTTSSGYAGSVFVPDTVFGDTSAVQQLIEAEVAQVVAAQAIAGTVGGA